MKPCIKSLLATLVVILSLAAPVLAGPWEDGVAAYKRGDYAKAAQFWRPLAEQGDDRAEYNLGVMYEHGKGVTQDYAEAVKWFRKAAELGVPDAPHNLGLMYDNGAGVPQDLTIAAKWYLIATGLGHPEAMAKLTKLQSMLTEEQITKSAQLVREWLPKKLTPAKEDPAAFDRIHKSGSDIIVKKEIGQKLVESFEKRMSERGGFESVLDTLETWVPGKTFYNWHGAIQEAGFEGPANESLLPGTNLMEQFALLDLLPMKEFNEQFETIVRDIYATNPNDGLEYLRHYIAYSASDAQMWNMWGIIDAALGLLICLAILVPIIRFSKKKRKEKPQPHAFDKAESGKVQSAIQSLHQEATPPALQPSIPEGHPVKGLVEVKKWWERYQIGELMNRKLIAAAIGAIGLFFLTSGFQSVGENWFGQYCSLYRGGYCIHPEWFAVGGALLFVAFVFYRHQDRR